MEKNYPDESLISLESTFDGIQFSKNQVFRAL